VNEIAEEDREYVERLKVILEEKQPQTLGELRRSHGLDPIRLNIVTNSYPFLFETRDVLKGRNPFPTLQIQLRKQPDPEPVIMPELESNIRAALQGSGENGLSLQRLNRRHKVTTAEALQFAQNHSAWVEITERFDQQRRKKLFIRLKGLSVKTEPLVAKVFHDGRWISPADAPDDQLKQDMSRLVGILRDGSRLSSWLEPMIAWTRVQEVALFWPNLLVFNKSGNLREWFVGLRPEVIEPVEIIEAHLPESKPREPMAEPSAEEKMKMVWKPNSPHQHAGQSTDPKAYQHRVRRPLVEL
jgi:hypothetical protein